MRARGRSAGGRLAGRVVAALLGLVAAFALIEGALWTASLFVVPEDRFARLAPAAGERRILCFGDSNTYGVNLPAEASYPAQLGRFLSRAPDNPWRVVNLGYPGQNSAQVRGRLSENLALYRPEVVIVLIGVNNSWSFAMSHLWDVPDAEPEPGWLRSLAQRCRTLGALRMLRHRWMRRLEPRRHDTPGRDQVPVPGGAERGEGVGDVGEIDPRPDWTRGPSDLCHGLGIDLRRMRRICDEHAAKLCLVTYPIDVPFVVEKVNPCIRACALESATPLVDLEAELLPIIRRLGRPLLQFEDYHATALGNYETARLVLAGLVSHGVLEPRPGWTDVTDLESRLSAFRVEARGREGRLVHLDLSGKPFASYRAALEARVSSGDGGTLQRVLLPLRARGGLTLEEQRGYFGRLDWDGSGRADLVLPADETGRELATEAGGRFLGWRLSVLLGKDAARGEREGQITTFDLDPESDLRR